MSQERSPFDDGLPEGDEEEVEAPPSPEVKQEEEPPAVAAPVARQARRRGPGKKRRGREPLPEAQPFVAETTTAAAALEPTEELPQEVESGINPKDPLLYWPKIIESARAKGMGPEYLQIRIERAGVGAHPTPFIIVETIEGEMVAGDETTAGQTLVDYLTNVVHMGRKVPGRAVYKLFVFYKVKSSGGFPVMTIQLDHPDEIRAQQMRRAEYFRNREAPSLGMGNPPPMPGMGYRGPLPQAPPPPTPPPFYSTVPPTGGGLADTLAQLRAYEEWRQQTIAAGQPAPPPAPQIVHMPAPAPPPPPPAPPARDPEVEELIFEAKMHRYIEKMGYVKPGVGAPAKPAEIKNQASGFKEIIQAFKELETFKSQIREAVGVGGGELEEEPEPKEPEDKISVVQIPGATIGGRPIMLPRKTKGTIDFFQQAVMSNLETSQELAVKALGGVAQALDKTSFGKLLENLAQKGGAPAQVAQIAKTSGMVGTGAVNGATPLPQRPRGPMA